VTTPPGCVRFFSLAPSGFALSPVGFQAAPPVCSTPGPQNERALPPHSFTPVALGTTGKGTRWRNTFTRKETFNRLFPSSGTMFKRSRNVQYLLSLVPGKQRLGPYRFLPLFFCMGGAMEWIMINVRIGRETFCEYI